MTRRWRWGGLVAGVALLWAQAAVAKAPPGGQGCRKTAVLDASMTGGAIAGITDNAARVCSVEMIATAANGWVQVYDSPTATNPTHAQAKTIAEPGAATSGNSASVFFGELGRPANDGLGIIGLAARAIVHYQD